MKDEHTAAIDFQSRQPKGVDLATRIHDAKAVSDALLVTLIDARKQYDRATDQYLSAYETLRKLRAMADRVNNG